MFSPRCLYLILIVVCSFRCFNAAAQQPLVIHGVVSKKLSGERISQVVIHNLKSNELMMSDDVGWFTIKAGIGDTLLFTKEDYTAQKIVILNGSDMPVYMQPVIKLATVTIQGQTKKQELQDVMKDYNRKGVYYNGNPPLASILLNPLNDLHEWFGKDAANLRRFKKYSKDELENSSIDKRYNISLVKRVTNTSDSTAKKFMEYYRPSYEDIKSWNDYDLIRHIRKSYAFYDKSDDKERLEKSVLPSLVKPAQKKQIEN